MTIQTTRFGAVAIEAQDLIQFPEGILGFHELHKFVLLDDPNDEIFAWLQSCEEPGIAFPVLEPALFTENLNISIAKADNEILQLGANDTRSHFCIVTIPEDPTMMTANLKAPIVINNQTRIAKQCVLQDNHLAIREPIFTKLQSRVVQNPERSIKQQSTSLEDVAVKIGISAEL